MGKEKVIRIGAFFDGTGNNRWVDEAMHDGSQTNVAKIRQLYEKSGYVPLYEEGVGTEDYRGKTFTQEQMQAVVDGKDRRDEYRPLGLATGYGCKMHVERMMKQVDAVIDKILKVNPEQKIVIDVYGFSRGAAEARDFINEFNQKYTTLDGKSMIGFVGIFDTVASIGLANGLQPDYNLNLNKDSASHIEHIVSQDEHRANFKLTRVLPANSADNIHETALKGVHADIGGGYGVHDGIEILLVENSKKGRIISTDDLETTLASMEQEAKAKGHGLIYETFDIVDEDNYLRLITQETEERHVKFGLGNAALNRMYERITASGIALPPLSILGEDKTTLKDGTEVIFSNYKAPEHVDDSYVHTSASDEYGKHWTKESIPDHIAYHEQKELLFFGKSIERVYFDNIPEHAETRLLNFSQTEKAILLLAERDDIKIIGDKDEANEFLNGQYSKMAITDIAQLLAEQMKSASKIDLLLNSKNIVIDDNGNRIDASRLKLVTLSKEEGGEIEVDTEFFRTQHVYGLDGSDVVTVHGSDDSHLETGRGDDILIGGKGEDRLEGGMGYDTYKVGNDDVINDIDNSGKIYFDATLLSGTKYNISPGLYEDRMFIYKQEDKTLIITQKEDDKKSITIENWEGKTKEALGIKLIEERNPDIALQSSLDKMERDEEFLADSTTTKSSINDMDHTNKKPNIVNGYNLDKQAELREKYLNPKKQRIDPYKVDNPEHYNMEKRIELAERINAQRDVVDIGIQQD